MIDFVTVTVADPTAPEGTVQLLHVPALVQIVHPDGSVDLTVFANAALIAGSGVRGDVTPAPGTGPCFFLERVPLDASKSRAPSYAREEEPKPPPIAPAAPKPGERAPIVHSDKPRVFGKGVASRASTKSSSVRRFESAGVAAAKGTADASQILRQVGSPKAMLPGQKPPRVFVRGKGEITSKQAREAQAKEGGEINPELDPLGALEAILGTDDATPVPELEAAPEPGEVPSPVPMINGTKTNGGGRVSSSRPL